MAYKRVNWENLPSKNTPVNADNLNKVDEGIANAVEKSDLLNLIYPVGSIYMSVNNTSPATLFGGTWSQIKGRFLLGTGSLENNNSGYFGLVTAGEINAPVGEQGGETWHRLTINEMPSHNHKLLSNSPQGSSDTISILSTFQGSDENAAFTHSSDVGGSEAHNNIPPYFAVNIWQRTA